MHILFCETSTKILTLGISQGSKVLAYRREEAGFNQAQRIFALIPQLLKTCHVKITQVDALALGIGPGSFTGLRVGAATIKGLAYALKKPIAVINSLDIIAENGRGAGENISVMLDAKKGNVYAAFYAIKKNVIKRKGGYFLGKIDDWLEKLPAETVLLGDAISIYQQHAAGRQFLDEKFWYPQPEGLAGLAAMRLKSKQTADALDLAPFYLYPKECTIQKR